MAQQQQAQLPPLEWLRVFEAAGRNGNFTTAAQELGLTQAAVSQRIRNLELRLGKVLFYRKPRGVELTLDGESYLPHVQSALLALTRSTADLFSQPVSQITIVAMPSHIKLLILPRLAPFLSAHPQLRVNFISAFRQSDFDDGLGDFHLRYGNGEWAGRQATLVEREILAPAGAPALCREAGTNWRDLPLLELTGPRFGWREWSAATGSSMPFRSRLRFDSFDLLLQAAIEGLGVMLASLPLSQTAFERRDLIRLSEPEMTMDTGYWLSWGAHQPRLAIHDHLMQVLGS